MVCEILQRILQELEMKSFVSFVEFIIDLPEISVIDVAGKGVETFYPLTRESSRE